MSEIRRVRRALISVYDKTGVADFARGLSRAGVEIVSTGSTAGVISDAGVPVTRVEELTGFPECLDGRVKTLHPRVHAGILADRRRKEHAAQLEELGIEPFDLVAVNLYPFRETVASGAGYDDCVEKIDIGGPAMVRAAAKNHGSVAVVVEPSSYAGILDAVEARGGLDDAERARLAAAAFRHTAEYDAAVAGWLSAQTDDEDTPFGPWRATPLRRAGVLRYGENPHQPAALYTTGEGGLAGARQHQGKPMSFNNYQDADAAWRAAGDHEGACVAIVKHTNPCGIAVADSVEAAHAAAHACDPVSAYGGVVAANRTVTAGLARALKGIFTEVLVAPGFEPEALEILKEKKNLRVLEVTEPDGAVGGESRTPISGGELVQLADRVDAPGDDQSTWRLVAGEAADEETLRDLEFAWRSVRAAKSNAILLARGGATVGVGMGQVNRLDSARLAVERANTLAEGEERARGSAAASDAFFPFADGLEILANAGVRAVVQPGGSIRDEEVVEAAKKAGVTMYLTGERHFAH